MTTTTDPTAGQIRLPESTLRQMRDAAGWTPDGSSTLGHWLALLTDETTARKDKVASAFNSAI